jgi:uncharacterized protein YbaR (Trm112 family)
MRAKCSGGMGHWEIELENEEDAERQLTFVAKSDTDGIINAQVKHYHFRHHAEGGVDDMALEAYIQCPMCKHVYNIHKQLYDKGENFLMYCPKCMTLYPRKEGKMISANFPTSEKG